MVESPTSSGPALVLVCDDTRALLKVYARVLTAPTFEARCSFRIEKLLELIRGAIAENRPFGLILDGDIKIYPNDIEVQGQDCDLQTGEQALLEAEACLVAQGRSELLKGVLFCSGTPGYENRLAPLHRPGGSKIGFLPKPFTPASLRDAVSELLAANS